MGDHFLWIDTNDQLNQLATHLQSKSLIALDTEADSLHHYQESVCLVQISHQEKHFLIDPLASELNLAPLWEKLANEHWILHGADFDLRMLRRIGAQEPQSIFDTLLAAQILGHPVLGYAGLVEHFFQVTICKKNQKADWSQRPLSPSMLDYAVQDTRYLEPLAQNLTRLLKEKNRLQWHQQSCHRVLQASLRPQEKPAKDPWRIKGSNALSPPALAILKEIFEWREKEAALADVPSFRVAPSEWMLRLSTWAAAHPRMPAPAWSHWRHQPRSRRERYLIEAIERGRHAPPLPLLPRQPRPSYDSEWKARLEKLRQAREIQAQTLQLDPGFLASNFILQSLARDPQNSDQLIQDLKWCPWQAECFASTLQELKN